MVDNKNNGGYVKWRDMVWIFALAVSIPFAALMWHRDTPHTDAVSKDVFIQYGDKIDGKLAELTKKLDELKESLRDKMLRN